MKMKKFKATSPGLRHKFIITKSYLCNEGRPIKGLCRFIGNSFGRSSTTGRITSWHRGGGVKRKFRFLNNSKSRGFFISLGIFFDPNRSSFISLTFDILKKKFDFSITPFFSSKGLCVINSLKLEEIWLGCRTRLDNIPQGSIVYNVGKDFHYIGSFGRAAGTYCQILAKNDEHNYAVLRLPSGKFFQVSLDFYGNIGSVSNIDQNRTILGNAGSKRLKGRRPIVRGIAMNPVDHPHGGRTNGGRVSVSPWGRPSKNLKKKKIKFVYV
jgi:large subunit ribosomal protein L2